MADEHPWGENHDLPTGWDVAAAKLPSSVAIQVRIPGRSDAFLTLDEAAALVVAILAASEEAVKL